MSASSFLPSSTRSRKVPGGHKVLPDDVLYLVFDLFEPGAVGDGPRQRTLRHCALVCRQWRLPAQTALFQDLYFIKFISAAGGRPEWLVCAARSRFVVTRLEIAFEPAAAVKEVLGQCPGLHTLRLSGCMNYPMDWGVLLDSNLPNLKMLEVIDADFLVDSPIPASGSVPFQLEDLIMRCDTRPPSPAFLPRVLAASSATLKTLRLYGGRDAPSELYTRLSSEFPQVTANLLRLEVYLYPFHPSLLLVGQCSSLLHLDATINTQFASQFPWHAQLEALGNAFPLPATLRRLSFTLAWDDVKYSLAPSPPYSVAPRWRESASSNSLESPSLLPANEQKTGRSLPPSARSATLPCAGSRRCGVAMNGVTRLHLGVLPCGRRPLGRRALRCSVSYIEFEFGSSASLRHLGSVWLRLTDVQHRVWYYQLFSFGRRSALLRLGQRSTVRKSRDGREAWSLRMSLGEHRRAGRASRSVWQREVLFMNDGF